MCIRNFTVSLIPNIALKLKTVRGNKIMKLILNKQRSYEQYFYDFLAIYNASIRGNFTNSF